MHGTAPGEATVPITGIGGLVTLAVPESLPEGASPRTYNTDFNVGQGKCRDGLTRVYNPSTGSAGPNNGALAVSSTWNNPSGLLASSTFASFSPASETNSIDVTEFSFALSPAETIAGIEVQLTGYTSATATLQAQLVSRGTVLATKTLPLPSSPGALIFGGAADLWGTVIPAAAANAITFGVRLTLLVSGGFTGASGFAQNVQITLSVNTGLQTMQPLTTFTNQNGMRYNLVMDQGGNLWVESLDTAPNVLTLSRSGIAPGSMAVAIQGQGVEYMAFVNPLIPGGSDMPLQWTPAYTDRITQVGPGAAPVFTPGQASANTYPIASITQPAAKSTPYSYFLQSDGPGSNQPGNVVTFYYNDATTVPGPDTDLVDAFNSGYAVYLYASFTGTPGPFGPQVVQVTAVGEAQPPGQPRNFYYLCFQVSSVAYTYYRGSGNPGYYANYQRTLATLTTTVPVPNLEVNDQMAVTGVTPSGWDSTWTVTETPNASEMVITGSQVTAGTATFNYAVTNGTANPAVGELVTITNTLNAGGVLNVTQWAIATVTGGATGTFTLEGFPGTLNASFQTENGLADTSGTEFDFDPGAALVGTSTNPIYGNAGAGGDVVFNASGVFIDPGTYQGTQFFILRDGSYTCPAPPVVFTVPDNTTQLIVTNLAIGPPNVVGRGISITEAGQNGIPGENFFTLPDPVIFYVSGVKQTATSFFVSDNTSISATLFFTSSVLNSALAIDTYGYNLFNLIEIGDPAYVSAYDSRNCYGQPLNKVQNFLNLSFDGGYLQSSLPVPLGWSQPVNGSLTVSPIFGNSYYISNSTGSTLAQAGLIQQSAYLDAYQVPILESDTGYSVRITVRCPSGITTEGGSLVIAVQSGSTVLGSYSVPLSSLTTAYQRFTGVAIPLPGLGTIPANAMLQVYAANLPNGADVEIDRFDVFDTSIPVLLTTEYWSYSGLPTMVDGVTGQVLYTSENQQPVQCATVLYDTHYVAKGWTGKAPGSSLYSLQASPSLEPADWDEPEVSQRSGGSLGPFAWSGGEQWFAAASRAGLYLFAGGQPGKISQEVQQVWDAIDWNLGSSIWVDINLKTRRLMVGIPLSTPNFWLPNAPQATAPLNIASVQISYTGPRTPSILQVTFQTELPITEGQPYTLSGLTGYTALNGYSAVPVEVNGNVATFVYGEGVAGYSGTDTGIAAISGVATLTGPNVVLMLNFQGLDSGEELKGSPQMHTTMFGTLTAVDMRRKWSLWYGGVQSPFATTVQGVSGEQTRFGNGQGNSLVYYLDPTQNATDDGAIIDSLYTVAGLPNMEKRAEMPQLGPDRVAWSYMALALASGGNVNVRLMGDYLYYPEPQGYNALSVPGGFAPGLQPLRNAYSSLNFIATRTFFEFRQNDGNPGWRLSSMMLRGRKAPWSSVIGIK